MDKSSRPILQIRIAPKYFKTVRDNSITFQSINTTEKLYCSFYRKHTEMFKNKKKYQKLSISPDEFLGITRMETKMGDWRTVKKHCRTRNLRDILNLENVNYLILSKIINGQPRDIPKGDLGHFKTVSALKNYSLAFVLNEHCGGDIRLISNEIKHRLGKNTKASYQMKKIRKMLPLAQNLEGRKMDAIFAIKNLLKDK